MNAEGGIGKFRDVALHSRFGMALSKQLLRLGVKLDEELPKVALQASRMTSDTMVGYVTGTFKNLASFVIDFFLTLMILFYLLRDGEGYYHAFRNMTPAARGRQAGGLRIAADDPFLGDARDCWSPR